MTFFYIFAVSKLSDQFTFYLMKIVVAFDSWKGSLTAVEACRAAARGLSLSYPDAEVVCIPMADGGEGTASVLRDYERDVVVPVKTCDPLLRPIEGYYLRRADGSAIVELAVASGLTLLDAGERNAMLTTTRGFGELIDAAIRGGAREVICTLGGSATNDAGLGALQALGLKVYCDGYLLDRPVSGSDLLLISGFDCSELKQNLCGTRLRYLFDADIPFNGPSGAVRLYSAQKGVDEAMRNVLEAGMEHVAEIMERATGVNPREAAGAGAAGGTGGGFASLAGASPERGIEFVMHNLNFDEIIKDADLVITGEGKADMQSLQGKVVAGVLSHTHNFDVPVVLMTGAVENRQQLERIGFAKIFNINAPEASGGNLPYPDRKATDPEAATARIANTSAQLLRFYQ